MPPCEDRRRPGEVARERIDRLLELAEQAALEDRLSDASRYGQLAWRLSTRHELPIEGVLKARVCRSCKAYLLPGRSARVRLEGGKVSRTCLSCGEVRRRPLNPETREPDR